MQGKWFLCRQQSILASVLSFPINLLLLAALRLKGNKNEAKDKPADTPEPYFKSRAMACNLNQFLKPDIDMVQTLNSC